jgi:hypothetical protein
MLGVSRAVRLTTALRPRVLCVDPVAKLVSVEPHLRASPAGNQSEHSLGSRFSGNGRRSLVKNTDPRVYLLADPNPVCLAGPLPTSSPPVLNTSQGWLFRRIYIHI